MNDLVTLVTPVYNAMPYLKDYLDSVIAQTWRPIELILVDDGSTDDTRQYLLQEKSQLEAAGITVKLLFLPHAGQAAAMSAALPQVTGHYFTWCDGDDLLAPESIERKALWLKTHPDTELVRSNGLIVDADQGIVLGESAREADKQDQNIFPALLQDQTYCYAGCYMMTAALLFACYPDRKIPISEEGQNLQLLLPPASHGNCGFIDEKLHIYCRRSSGHSSLARSYQDNLRRLKNFSSLKIEILRYCSCCQTDYVSMIKELEAKNMHILVNSAIQRARADISNLKTVREETALPGADKAE